MSLIVIGTDTGVGKTICCAALLVRYGSQALSYWKPIATGAVTDRDADVVRELSGGAADVLAESYLFEPPVSPHLAARQAGTPIDPEKLVDALDCRRRAQPGRSLLIEGIGGLLVPLTDSGYLLADLIREMRLPCLLVATSRVGTINHALLTLEAARSRQLEVVGVILNGPPNRDNRDAIERFGKTRVLGEIYPLEPLSRESVAQAAGELDQDASLQPYLQAV